jgi:hypothetical protein
MDTIVRTLQGNLHVRLGSYKQTKRRGFFVQGLHWSPGTKMRMGKRGKAEEALVRGYEVSVISGI